MSWWHTPDVTGWTPAQQEPRGLRAKLWVEDDGGQLWLRKERRESRPYEPAIEALTLELARRCQFEVAQGRACTWTTPEGAATRGFVSKKFHDLEEPQTTGGELVGPFIDAPYASSSERDNARARITLDVVQQVLDTQARGRDLRTPFLRMLIFDAWIGNGDRHSGNWAILSRDAACRLAPMYDTAGCLGAELTDRSVEQRLSLPGATDRYVNRCKSGFGDGVSKPGINQQDLIAQMRTWPEWIDVAPPLIEYIFENFAMVSDSLASIPDDWLSPPRRRLVEVLLEARVKMLQGLLSS